MGGDQIAGGKGNDDDEGEEEHPFHEGDHIVALDDGTAYSEVESKAERIEDSEADA